MEAIQQEELATIFGQALSLPPYERAAFLDEACRGDANLRAELDSLLAYLEPGEAFFESLKAVVPRPPQEDPNPRDDPHNLSGATIGHYRVIEKLGGGGMGVVYKAEDTKLRRTVALKFLPPLWSHDAQARQRFVAEAQAASALDHNNICTIYEIGETDDGRTFIAMAYYAGETLKHTIKHGPLAVEDALDYAAQIARGLAKAHGRDIVHRDVKPANVMVTTDGVVKILDFGLAKIADQHLTQTGATMGTVPYMSPEQAHGETVDHRTDVWSLGVVLYEMLTGQRPFKGDYAEAVVYSVMNDAPPPITSINPDVPPDLAPVVSMCLEKKRSLRYPSMNDLLADLEAWTHDSGLNKSTFRYALRRRRQVLTMLTSAVVVLALAVAVAIPGVRQAVTNVLSGGSPTKSLAVLPFTDLGADSTNQAYSEGLRLQLTSTLTQMKRYAEKPLRVVSADEVGEITSAAEAQRTFGVQQVIRGAIHRQGQQVRLDLTLVDTQTREQINALTLNEPVGDATFQGETVEVLAELLGIALTAQARRALTVGGTSNSRAYDYYLTGSGHLKRYELPENVNTAIRFFQFALDEDETYAQAHAGLGEAYWRKYDQTKDTSWVSLARRHCEQALALENQLPAPHLTLGLLYYGTGDYEKAVDEYTLALALDSSNAQAYAGQGRAFQRLRRLDEAENSYLKAIAAQPDYDLAYLRLGTLYMSSGRFEDAVAQYQKVIRLVPDNYFAHTNLGAAYLRLERMDDARRALEGSIEIRPSSRAYSNLGYIAYTEGRHRDEVYFYEQALALDSTRFAIWGNLANAYKRVPEEEAKAHDVYQRAARVAEAQLEINPNNATILVNLANYYAYLDREVEAAALLERALTIEPGNVAVMIKAAYQYERLNERDKALTWIGRALELGYPVGELEIAGVLDSLRDDPRYQQLLQETARRP